MTDRLKGFTVILKEDLREDDAEALIQAISMLRGVLKVRPVISEAEDNIAIMRERHLIADRLVDFVRSELLR